MAEEQPKAVIKEIDGYSLFTEVGGNKRASLNWSSRGGYPRITVFTRTESDKDSKGFITAAFDLDHFLIMLDRLLQIAAQPSEMKEKAVTKHWPREGGKITGDLAATSEVWYGKDAEGVMWISVLAAGPGSENRPKIKFDLNISNYHEFIKDGRPVAKNEMSVAFTRVRCRVLTQKFIDECAPWRDTSIKREPRTDGARTGGARASNYQASAGSSDAADMESDIPY